MITIKKKKTSRGLSVVFVRNPNLSGVSVTVFVHVGSSWENKKNNGISHLLEHLIFQNSSGEKTKKFFPLNLEFNAWTRKDLTVYEISHHKDNLKKIIEILFSCVNNFDFSEDDLERQKEVVAREIKEREEEAFALLAEEMDGRLYKNSLNFKVSGEKKNLEQIDIKSLKSWYNRFYVPANMILAVSGNFNTQQAFKTIEDQEQQEKENKGNKFYPLFYPHYQKNGSNFSVNKNFDQAYLSLAFPAPVKMGDVDYFKYLLLAEILDKQLKLLRKKESDLYDLDLYFHHFLHTGEIRLETSTDKKRADRVRKKIAQQLYDLEISSNFSEKLRGMVKKQFLLRKDSIDDLSSLAMYRLAGNKIFTPQQEAREIGKVKFEDLKKAKNNIINRNNCYSLKLK